MKRLYYYRFIIIIIIVLVFVYYDKINIFFSSIVNDNNKQSDLDKLKRVELIEKGKYYIINSKYDSLEYLIDVFPLDDTSEELIIFKLYNFAYLNDSVSYRNLLDKTLNIHSQNEFYLTGIGSLLFDNGKLNESLQFYKIADSLSFHKNYLAVLNCAVIYTIFEQNDKAVLALTSAIALNDSISDLYYARAVAYYNKTKYYEAVIDLNHAIDLDNFNPKYYHLRSLIFEKTGNTKAAEIDKMLAEKYGYEKQQ